MWKKQRLLAGRTAGSGGRAAGILALPDDVMVQIFQHVDEDGIPFWWSYLRCVCSGSLVLIILDSC